MLYFYKLSCIGTAALQGGWGTRRRVVGFRLSGVALWYRLYTAVGIGLNSWQSAQGQADAAEKIPS